MRKKTVVLIAVALVCLALPALAQEPGQPVGRTAGTWGAGALGAAFLLGVAAAAGAIAQGRATSAAAEGMSRNPGAAGPIRTMIPGGRPSGGNPCPRRRTGCSLRKPIGWFTRTSLEATSQRPADLFRRNGGG